MATAEKTGKRQKELLDEYFSPAQEFYRKGMVAYRQGRRDEAVSLFREAAGAGPGKTKAEIALERLGYGEERKPNLFSGEDIFTRQGPRGLPGFEDAYLRYLQVGGMEGPYGVTAEGLRQQEMVGRGSFAGSVPGASIPTDLTAGGLEGRKAVQDAALERIYARHPILGGMLLRPLLQFPENLALLMSGERRKQALPVGGGAVGTPQGGPARYTP